MNALKRANMMRAYTGFRGPATLSAIKAGVPSALWDRLTGRELGMVLDAINEAYHRGRASMGAEVIDGSFVWINDIGAVDLDAYRAIAKMT